MKISISKVRLKIASHPDLPETNQSNGVKKVSNDSSHYSDVIMGAMASQITSLTIVYSTVYAGTDQRKHQSYASLAFVREVHRWPVDSPHKGPVTQKNLPFDDVVMFYSVLWYLGPVWLDQNQIWILKCGSWNHGVVNKQNVESESGFLKTNAKSGSRFYPDVVIHQFYPYEFYQNVVVLFH